MVKNGCLYMSAVKCNKRSDNTFAKLSNGSYVNLIYFIEDSDNKKEYVIVKKIHTIDAFQNTLRKNILRSKEMYLIDSISLYQTIRYLIQLNIF